MSTRVYEPRKSLSGVRLLLADDYHDFVTMLRAYFGRDGVIVDWAADGASALKQATESHYDLIMLDVQMPEVDGYEVARRLRQQGFTGPLLCVTAHAMREHIDAARLAGCDRVVTKPVSLPELRALICEVLTPYRQGSTMVAQSCTERSV
jgi:CheY-like chemotaxis protein